MAGSVTTAAPTYTTGNINPLSLATTGALRVDIGATSANGTAIKVDGSAVTQPVSGTVSITANSAVNVAQINGITPLMGAGNNGTGAQRISIATDQTAVTTAGVFSVKIDQTTDGTTNKVAATQATASNLNAQVVGAVAHDGVDSGNPIKVGHKAIAHGTNPTAVAAADRTDWYANRAGVPFVIGGHPNIVTFEAAYTAAQTDAAIVTIAGGLKIVVTEIEALCDNANTVDVGVRVGFGATTTPTTTGVVLTHPGISAGSGVIRGNGSGIVGVGADGEDLRITCEAPTTGSIRILVSYYTIES